MARIKTFDPDVALEQAMLVFWRYGYEGASMQMLVEAMGINRSSLYATYGDKHALYLATLDRYEHDIHALVAAHFSDAAPVGTAFRSFFESAVEVFLGFEDHRGCFLANATVDRAPHDAETAARARASLEQIEALFHAVLLRAREHGELPRHHDLRRLARYFTNAFTGLRVVVKVVTDRAVLADIIDQTLAVLD